MVSRVLIVTRDYPPTKGGVSDHSKFLVRWLGNEVDHISIVCQIGDFQHRDCDAQSLGNNPPMFFFNNVRHLFKTVHTAILDSKPDVVIVQYVPHMWGRAGVAPRIALLPAIIRLRYNIPAITFLHELHYDWSLNPKRLVLGLIHRFQLATLGVSSPALIVTNQHRLLRVGRLFTHKVRRIPAGNVSGRNENGVSGPPFPWPYITWYGTLSEGQRLETLVKAFCRLSSDIPELRLVLVGGFDVHSRRIESIFGLCGQHGVASRLIIEGFTEEDRLSQILSGSVSNIHINSSGPSGRRTVIAAYLRSGRPIIAIDGYERDPEFIHGSNILLVPDQDEMQMSTAIRNLYGNDEMSSTLSNACRRLYQAEFSDKSITERFLDVINWCLTNKERNRYETTSV